MKKLSWKRWNWEKTRAIRRRKNNVRSNKSNKHREKSPWSSAIVLKAPDVFHLLDHNLRKNFLAFIEKLRQTENSNNFYLLDFSGTRRIHADAMILFRAEICRLLKKRENNPKFRCKLPHDTKIKEVLQQTEIFSIIGQSVRVRARHPDVVHWKTANGTRAEGEKYDTILGHYEGKVTDALLGGLFVGITEAMTNICHHAYIEPSGDRHVLKYCRQNAINDEGWVMFSQHKDGKLYVVICDLGVGIPGTLPRTKRSLWQKLIHMGLGEKDGKYIEYAVQDSISRMRKKHRGKGLGQIATGLLEHNDKSKLIIYSNRGCYIHEKGKQLAHDFKDSIFGTVICWQTPLEI